jgi:FixJ family two-component response regulator
MIEPEPVVFLLDDDHSVVAALGRLLRQSGFTVRGFTSVAEFLTAHDAETPGCLVMDVSMPGLTGLELQSALAERGDARAIVFVTGRGNIRTAVQALKAGAVTLLSKPVQREELIAAVEEAIAKDGACRSQRREEQEISRRVAKLTAREVGADRIYQRTTRKVGALSDSNPRYRRERGVHGRSLRTLLRWRRKLGSFFLTVWVTVAFSKCAYAQRVIRKSAWLRSSWISSASAPAFKSSDL